MKKFIQSAFGSLIVFIYLFAGPVTFVYLLIHDWKNFNALNWIVIIPLDAILAGLWPIYWIIHFLFGIH